MARRSYQAVRARKSSHTHTLDRARYEYGLARFEQIDALAAFAQAEDQARAERLGP
jgi:hypothetical protein